MKALGHSFLLLNLSMRNRHALLALLALGVAGSGCVSPTAKPSTRTEVTRESVEAMMHRVADWQLAYPHFKPLGDWFQGPFVNGLFALGSLPGNERYLNHAMEIGRALEWDVISTTWVANDHCTPQTWLELYELKKDPEMIARIRAALDEVMSLNTNANTDVKFTRLNRHKWSWCDALYMSPPTFAKLGRVTGDRKYYDYLHKWWWIASEAYYDKEEHLFYRDHMYVKPAPMGSKSKVFWGRGNGWVVGGLVRVLQALPKDDPMRGRYEQQLTEMCQRLLQLQRRDGLWTASLLDPQRPPGPESSGSGFFIYGLAYAINEGLIGEEHKPAVLRAWSALAGLVKDDGQLTHVQQEGDSPVAFDPDNTEPYAVGAFLLAGSEVWRLLQ